MSQYRLSQISLGKADGELEAQDENFIDMFYKDNNKYNEILEKDKFIVSGRKGTGKTILAKYMEKTQNCEENRRFVKYSKIEDIKLRAFIEKNSANIATEEFNLFQEYHIYVEIAGILKANVINFANFMLAGKNPSENPISALKNYIRYTKSIRKLIAFLNARNETGNFFTKSINEKKSRSSTAEFSAKHYQNVSAGVKRTDAFYTDSIKEQKEYYKILDELKQKVLSCLKYVSAVFIIDDLEDLQKMLKNTSDFYFFIATFIKTIRKINIEIQDVNASSKCIILIRSDILLATNNYDGNINKQIVDAEVELNWMNKKASDDLTKMILNKIKNSNAFLKEYDLKAIEKMFFPPPIKNNCSFTHELLKNTFGRPRDVVMFLNALIMDNPNASSFKISMFKNSALKYSSKFFGELCNEMSTLHSRSFTLEVERMLREFNRSTFRYNELELFFRKNSSKFPTLVELTLAETVTQLYTLGVLGNVSNTNSKKHHSWAYRPDGSPTPNFGVNFTIHMGLKKALNVA